MSNDFVMIPVKIETKMRLKQLKKSKHFKNMDVTLNELVDWYEESVRSSMK